MKRVLALLCCSLAVAAPCMGQAKSPKRGICWDEKTQRFSDAPIDRMLPGVSWIYTWGESPQGTAENLGTADGIAFAPMAWGRDFNEATIRNYVSTHPTAKYLLGFNEPNFSAQANMTPSEAVELWPTLEAIATEYGLKLVSPALNFTGETVGGRVWGIYDWLDEFIRVYKEQNGKLPKMDCIALHCYMNWYGANTWFVNEYIYSDIFKNGNDTRYPNIVEVLNTVKAATGQYPRMMLTEFCSWEGNKDGFVTNVDNQIDQMTQRIQKMEQSDLVEGYAWFMANTNVSQYPYMSAFQTNSANSELSMLGTVLVHMSAFDLEKYYTPGEKVMAKDYVEATTDDQIVRLRPNSETGSEIPLQIQLTPAARDKSKYSAATYQIDVPEAGNYTFTLHASTTDAKISIKAGDAGNGTEVSLTGHSDQWTDYSGTLALEAGKSNLTITNLSDNSVLLNSWSFSAGSGINDVTAATDGVLTVYNLQGVCLGKCSSLSELNLGKGIYIVVDSKGQSRKVIL